MPALSKQTIQKQIVEELCSQSDFNYSEEEMFDLIKSYESTKDSKKKKITPYNLWLKKYKMSPRTMGDAWKEFQQNDEEMECLQREVDELNESEERDNQKPSKPRGPSSWNRFRTEQKGSTKDACKEKWNSLSQEEKDAYKF